MFNIMNNMVALARKRSELLEPSLIKLSSLLRYMLYGTKEKVSLERELNICKAMSIWTSNVWVECQHKILHGKN